MPDVLCDMSVSGCSSGGLAVCIMRSPAQGEASALRLAIDRVLCPGIIASAHRAGGCARAE